MAFNKPFFFSIFSQIHNRKAENSGLSMQSEKQIHITKNCVRGSSELEDACIYQFYQLLVSTMCNCEMQEHT